VRRQIRACAAVPENQGRGGYAVAGIFPAITPIHRVVGATCVYLGAAVALSAGSSAQDTQKRLTSLEVNGTFHADPHPGNVLVLRDGQLALIDFGQVGRLDSLQQAALRGMLLALSRRHPSMLREGLLDVRLLADARDRQIVMRLVSQLVLAFVGAAIGLMAVLLLGTDGGPMVGRTMSVFDLFGYLGLVVSAVLLLRVIVTIAREQAT
jgi:hypothetical protein